MLAPEDCFRLVKPVDIGAVLPVLAGLPFFAAGQSRPGMYQCDVLVRSQFPPELLALMEGLDLGGHTARAVLRRLAPGQSIPPHVDQWMGDEHDWRRFQVPLTSDPKIVMRWPDDDQEAHLEPGNLYEVRFDRTHEVINGADVARIHLQIDQVDATT